MAGRISYYGNTINSTGRPGVVPAMIGKSTVIRMGDLLIRTTSASFTAGNPTVRAVNSGDTLTVTNPPYGVASMDITTDSSGYVVASSSPVTVDNRKRVNYALSSMGQLAVSDPDTNYMIFQAWALGMGNMFACDTQASDVADWYALDRAYGVVASAATPPIEYSLDDDAAAANAPFRGIKPDVMDSQFNSANGGGRIIVFCLDSFNGFLTGLTATN